MHRVGKNPILRVRRRLTATKMLKMRHAFLCSGARTVGNTRTDQNSSGMVDPNRFGLHNGMVK